MASRLGQSQRPVRGSLFLDLPAAQLEALQCWPVSELSRRAAREASPSSLCKLTDLCLGGLLYRNRIALPEKPLMTFV